MKKVLIKIISVVLVVFLCASMLCNVDATSGIIKSGFTGNANATGSKPIVEILSAVLSVVRNVGVTVAIVILMTIGAKYIIASAGDRADIKKYAMNYIIGAVILFGATGVLSVVKAVIDESLK